MTCANCGAEIPAGAAACPACSAPAPVPAAAPAPAPAAARVKEKTRRWTASDILGGIPFLLGGTVLFIVYLVRFFQTAGPAREALSGLSALGGLGSLIGTANVRFYYAPLVLDALSNLAWWLAGLFLMLAGLYSLFKARGTGQAGTALTLMIIGFFASLLRLIVVEGDALLVTGQQMQANWTPFIVQGIIIVATFILVRLKVRARKKLMVENAALLIQITGAAPQPAADGKGKKGKKEKKAKAPKPPKKEKAKKK